MTTVIEFAANDKPGAKAHVAALHKALSAVIDGGFVDHITINGTANILLSANTPERYSSFHPTDEKQDKHTPSAAAGGVQSGNYIYTLISKP